MIREDLRNIAIIAHVDHGKTTLVDQMLKQGGVLRKNQALAERVMDSTDLERERGITILAKNTSVYYNGVKINIVDTPGHADFSGEVERILKMVNGALLLVDAAEGPMPQTRFVLRKALEMRFPILIVINKIDRPDARVREVEDGILNLLIELDADPGQLDYPVIYCSGRNGTSSLDPDRQDADLEALFETILKCIPAPGGDADLPARFLVSSIDYNDYVGRMAVGRLESGTLRVNQDVSVRNKLTGGEYRTRISGLFLFDGLKKTPASSVEAGDIAAVSGAGEINIGDTICEGDAEPLDFVTIGLPTIQMTFSVNDSPLAGREGKFVTSRQLRDRLYRELLKDVSLRVEDGETPDQFLVSGRGEMHLSVLIETMRREGFEFAVSRPRALFIRDPEQGVMEPFEIVAADVPKEHSGAVIDKLLQRKGELTSMSGTGERTRLDFRIPSRGLLGYRSEFLTDTRGEGVMSAVFDGYSPYRGDMPSLRSGSLIASEAGESLAYGLAGAQERGSLLIGPGVKVYEGMIVGTNPRKEDVVVNVCRAKHVTNVRAVGSDENIRLTPPLSFSLEEFLGFLGDDELLEVTPKNLRVRKVILDKGKRLRAESQSKNSQIPR